MERLYTQKTSRIYAMPKFVLDTSVCINLCSDYVLINIVLTVTYTNSHFFEKTRKFIVKNTETPISV
jgi:hypothetical protein